MTERRSPTAVLHEGPRAARSIPPLTRPPVTDVLSNRIAF